MESVLVSNQTVKDDDLENELKQKIMALVIQILTFLLYDSQFFFNAPLTNHAP